MTSWPSNCWILRPDFWKGYEYNSSGCEELRFNVRQLKLMEWYLSHSYFKWNLQWQKKLITLLTHFINISWNKQWYSQNSFGFRIRHNWTTPFWQSYDFDSISVSSDIGADAGGGFGEFSMKYEVSKGFSLHNKLNTGQRFVSLWCCTTKIRSAVIASAEKWTRRYCKAFALRFYPSYHNWSQQIWKLKFFLPGVNTTFNCDTTDLITRKIPIKKGVTSVMNSLQNVVNPVNTKFAYWSGLLEIEVILWSKLNPISPSLNLSKCNW